MFSKKSKLIVQPQTQTGLTLTQGEQYVLATNQNSVTTTNSRPSVSGLARLTNVKRGDYYGQAKHWSLRKKREFGLFLLKRAMKIFLSEGERQIKPRDLKT